MKKYSLESDTVQIGAERRLINFKNIRVFFIKNMIKVTSLVSKCHVTAVRKLLLNRKGGRGQFWTMSQFNLIYSMRLHQQVPASATQKYYQKNNDSN